MLYPGLTLLALGAAARIWLPFWNRQQSALSLGIQTKLACATAIIVWIQTIGLAVVARSHTADLGLFPPHLGLEPALGRISLDVGWSWAR